MTKNEIKLTIVGGVALAVIAGLILAAESTNEDALRIWCIGCTLLLPVTGYAGWWARGRLARAEKSGLDTGMTHTLEVVRAVRAATPTPVATQSSPMILPAPDFELVRNEQRVIDL